MLINWTILNREGSPYLVVIKEIHLLLLQINFTKYERDFILYHSNVNQAAVIEAFNIHLDDWL